MIEFAHIRNMLILGQFEEAERKMLSDAHAMVLQSEGPFSVLIDLCIKNCLQDIKTKNFISASNEINFIHNLPIKYSEIKDWDEKHFYTIEILNYLENNEDFLRIKNYISIVSEAQNKIDFLI